MKQKKKIKWKGMPRIVGMYAVLVVLAVIVVYPILWVIFSSVMESRPCFPPP